jgi:hypothetical protein
MRCKPSQTRHPNIKGWHTNFVRPATPESDWVSGEPTAEYSSTALQSIRRAFDILIEQTSADEIIAIAQIFDHVARLRSFEIAADIFETILHALFGASLQFDTVP